MKIAEIEFDGGCTGNGTAKAKGFFGYVLKFEGKDIEGRGAVKEDFVTNNVAEYTGLLEAIRRFKKECPNPEQYQLMIYGDSRLIIETVAKRWGWSPARVVWNPHKQQPHLRRILDKVLIELIGMNYQLVWVRREKNRRADALTRQ
jgi:ribonuclease HI